MNTLITYIFIYQLINSSFGKKICETLTDKDTGRDGICLQNSYCCSAPTVIGNLCSGTDVCCFGTNKCGYDNEYDPIDPNIMGCPGINIIPRLKWEAIRSLRPVPALMPERVTHVFIHHTDDGGSCYDLTTCMRRVKSIQSYHQTSKGWADIAHNFLIGSDGTIYEGRGWGYEGTHTHPYNQESIGIAFIGDYNNEEPNDLMIKAALNLIQCGVQRQYINRMYSVHGHSDARCTTCPGKNLYEKVRQWPNYQRGPLPKYLCNKNIGSDIDLKSFVNTGVN